MGVLLVPGVAVGDEVQTILFAGVAGRSRRRAAEHPISVPLLIAGGLGVGFTIRLWWLYFDLVAPATNAASWN
jgi:hypothetical protein